MTEGVAGMNEKARTGYWKEIHKESRSRRSDQELRKLGGGGGCIFAYFYLNIAVVRNK